MKRIIKIGISLIVAISANAQSYIYEGFENVNFPTGTGWSILNSVQGLIDTTNCNNTSHPFSRKNQMGSILQAPNGVAFLGNDGLSCYNRIITPYLDWRNKGINDTNVCKFKMIDPLNSWANDPYIKYRISLIRIFDKNGNEFNYYSDNWAPNGNAMYFVENIDSINTGWNSFNIKFKPQLQSDSVRIEIVFNNVWYGGNPSQYNPQNIAIDDVYLYQFQLQTTSISEVSEHSLIAYPNPSNTGVFNVNNTIQFVTDIVGRNVIFSQHNNQLDVSSNNKGVYFAKYNNKTIRLIYE